MNERSGEEKRRSEGIVRKGKDRRRTEDGKMGGNRRGEE
jgi:hypothetical protein